MTCPCPCPCARCVALDLAALFAASDDGRSLDEAFLSEPAEGFVCTECGIDTNAAPDISPAGRQSRRRLAAHRRMIVAACQAWLCGRCLDRAEAKPPQG